MGSVNLPKSESDDGVGGIERRSALECEDAIDRSVVCNRVPVGFVEYSGIESDDDVGGIERRSAVEGGLYAVTGATNTPDEDTVECSAVGDCAPEGTFELSDV